MSTVPNPEKITIEEYSRIIETMEERAELLDGQVVAMGSPSRTHQRISSHLHHVIEDFIRSNHGDCEVNEALNAYLDADNAPIPDVMVVCDPSKIDEKGCHGAPDWVVEITSTNRADDFDRKLRLYRKHGVREYWIVDTDERKVYVYDFDQHPNVVEFYDWTDTIPVRIYGGALKIRIEDLA